MAAPLWTDSSWCYPGKNPQCETSSNNCNSCFTTSHASALPTLEFQGLEFQGWLQQTTPLYQDLTSSVDLYQTSPQSSIQHHRLTCLNADDQRNEEFYRTYPFEPNPCTTELASRETLNSRFGDFNFDFDSELFERPDLSNDLNAMQAANLFTATTPPAPESYPTAMSDQTSQSGDTHANPSDKTKSMPQKGSSSVIFRCDKCAKTYLKRWQLNRHLKRHEKPFRCNASECNSAFALRKDLRRHMKEVHLDFTSEGDILKCIYQSCNFSSTRRDTLKRHLQRVHGVRISFEAFISPVAL